MPFSSIGTLFPDYCPKITDEQFNLFYSIDRDLYSMMVFNLGRDPEESMQVMGFLMWLELVICSKMDLVVKLLKLPFAIVNEVANESVTCLKCVESDILLFTDGICEIVLLPNLVGKKINLQLFHQIRFTVIHGVARRVNEVCVRAFKDIFQEIAEITGRSHHVLASTATDSEVGWSNNDYRRILVTDIDIQFGSFNRDGRILVIGNENEAGSFYGDGRIFGNVAGYFNFEGRVGYQATSFSNGDGRIFTIAYGNQASCFNSNGRIFTASDGNMASCPNEDGRISTTEYGNHASSFNVQGTTLEGGSIIPFPYDVGYIIGYPFFPTTEVVFHMTPGETISPQQILPAENVQANYARAQQEQISCDYLSPMFGRLNIGKSIGDILPDDRTIFLTFSVGYPTSELEVRNFFTRKFGDVIEAIYMQEVPPDEQVIYARVVARSVSMADAIVEGGKIKYNINGKHVWARKYVKRNK